MLNWNLFWFLWAWFVASDIVYGYFLHKLFFKSDHDWAQTFSSAIVHYPFVIGITLYFSKLYVH